MRSRGPLRSYTVHIGSSFMRFEPPDTCLVAYVGDLSGDDVTPMNAAIEEVAKSIDGMFMLVDLSRTGEVTGHAREGGLHGMRALNPRGTAVFGADFRLRVVATLITKAAALIDARVKGPVSFHEREDQARAWLEGVRRHPGHSHL